MTVPIQIVVVSMESATERRERMSAQFATTPFPWRFENASLGDGKVVPYDSKRTRIIKGRDLHKSELGCFESHVSAMRKFVTDGEAEFLLMCEDDVWIDFDFPFLDLLDAMKEAEIHYIRLYSRRVAPARHLQFWRNRWLLRFMWEPFGTQCYLISKAGAARILTDLTAIVRPIDDQLDRFWKNGFPIYSLYPHPVIELQSPSSILRIPTPQTRIEKWRHKAFRLWDRVRAVSHALRRTDQDRRFANALRDMDRRQKTLG